MQRCVIIGGAEIGNYGRIKKLFRDTDFFIYCDCGLAHREKLGKKPNLIIGDFDSHKKPQTDTETIVLPCEKDDTDTVFAVKEAISRGFSDFLLIGVIGGRLDHTLANVSILKYLDENKCTGMIADDFSEMETVSEESAFVDSSFSYFSLLNISGEASGITIRNAKYPLTDAEIKCDYQYGVSNEVLGSESAEISVKHGSLLLIKVY